MMTKKAKLNMEELEKDVMQNERLYNEFPIRYKSCLHDINLHQL